MHALSTDEATVNYVGIRPDLREQVPWTLRPVDVNVTTRRPSAKKPKAELEGGTTFGEETQRIFFLRPSSGKLLKGGVVKVLG